ncbi:AIPR family protein [Actinoalloteichus hymeniacidonis]|uniref:AIPR protein n=1 Tax=Actinoalloteichus hymeniacidonis TaxID=340345 RepID=A0AAC9HT27_9PSEU|nr:AIPR family protein [Actinoalloteichus hymeniacidonis]AOS64601.1 AIPR protein [Actinoalloteichus hymeniacidonis]MBB5907326.1 hypothetical protein [Actinoalloteichus hymeniacidonis]
MDLVIQRLVADFQHAHDLGALPMHEAFEAFAAYCLLSRHFSASFSPDAFRTGGGNDLGIDAIGLLVDNHLLQDAAEVKAYVHGARKLEVEIVLIQAKTSAGFETKVVSDLAENLRHVLDPAPLPYPASPSIDNLRQCLEIIYEDLGKLADELPKLSVYYVTTGEQVSDMVEQKAQSATTRLMELHRFHSVQFRCVPRAELADAYRRAGRKASTSFRMPKQLAMPDIPGVETAYTGLLPATTLVEKILTDDRQGLRTMLFHDNVRDFQGYNDVNAEIRDTLMDPIRRRRFAVLNNGITIVARKLAVAGETVHLTDFQIVNGCQTCHVLFDHRDQLTEEVLVNVRIVYSEDEDVISGIVAATNRQTAVSKGDLDARDRFHQQLEDDFQHRYGTDRRLYYERRSKQYSADPKVEKTRIIDRQQLSKAYLAMFLNEPARVGRLTELLAERGKELFVASQQPILYYTAAATLYRVDWLFRNRRLRKDLAPTKFHLLSAIRLRVLGTAAIPQTPKLAATTCKQVLDIMWDPAESERLCVELQTLIGRAVEFEETAAGLRVGEMVRNQRFADRIRRAVLGTD